MKFIITLVLAMIAGSSAEAAWNCKNRFGTVAQIQDIGNGISMNFSHPSFKPAKLKYSGRTTNNLYFGKSDKVIAIVEKSVFENGKGKVSYGFRSGSKSGPANRWYYFYCN
jgi:hypothetical protein